MGTTSLWGLTTGNPLTTSSEESIKDYFNGQSGDATTSNMWKIDLGAQGFNTRIIDLENKAENSFQLYTINLIWDSTVSGTDYYMGTSSLITSLEDKMMFLFYFNKTNTGSVTFKINALDTMALKKLASDGSLIVMDANDIKNGIPYYVQYNNGQMTFVGENYSKEISNKISKVITAVSDNFASFDSTGSLVDSGKNSNSFANGDGNGNANNSLQLGGQLPSYYGLASDVALKADKVIGATNGNLAGLNTNGNLTDSGIAINDISTKPLIKSITLLSANWVEDAVNGYWTQSITDVDIIDGVKVDITFDATNIKQLSEDSSSIIIRNNAGTATAYAFNNVPSVDITGQMEIRAVSI